MLEDKFKFTRANIVLIVINSILVIFVILASIQLIISLKSNEGEIPELKTTAGKSSTLSADATSTTTTESTTISTKKVGNDSSPYYDIDVYSIINKELVEKKDLTKDERIELGKQYFKIYEGLLVPSDDDFVNVNHLLSKVKAGESDKITVNGHDYGIIYNGQKIFESIFEADVLFRLNYIKFNDVSPLYINSSTSTYYKLGGDTKKSYIVDSYEYRRTGENTFKVNVIYTLADSKSKVYKTAYVGLKYNENEKKWKSDSFEFPNEDSR